MPLDPSIPLSIQPPRQPDQIGQAMQAYTLKSAMMESQRAEQQMRDSQVLRSVLSSPDAMTPDGSPKPETIQKLMASGNVGPAQQLLQADRQRKMDLQKQRETQMVMGEKFMNQAGPVYAGIATKLDQGAKWEDLKPEVDQANQQTAQLAQQAGIPFKPLEDPKQLESFASGWSKYSEHKMKMAETAGKAESAEGKILADVKAGRLTEEQGRKALEKKDKITVNVGAASPTKNPLGDDPNFWYEYYDKTKQLPPMAWGAAGNPTREAFLKGFPEWKKKQGGSASDTAATQASFKADAGALNAVTKDLNTFEPYKKMLDTNADIAIQLGQKIRQTLPVAVNKPLNWVRQNYGDNPDVAEFLAQMRFVQTEAARVINNPRIVGQLTDESRKEMDQVITGNAPIDVVERVLTRLKTDGNNRFNAMRSQQTEIVSKMKGSKDQTKEDKPTPKKPLSAFQN